MTPRIASVSLALSLCAPALADTFIVDDDGGSGVDFTDIPAAVAGSLPGDVLLIRPGLYSAFDLDKGLTLIGPPAGGALVAAGSTVRGIPAHQTAVLADLELANLAVKRCDGPVLMDRIEFIDPGPAGLRLRIKECLDVRVHRTQARSSSTSTAAVRVELSRVELVECTFTGRDGADDSCGPAEDGGDAVALVQSRVHLAMPRISGGEGGDQFATCNSLCGDFGGDGGTGCRAEGSELFVTGGSSDFIQGGGMGWGEWCDCDGRGGTGVELCAGTILHHPDIPRGGLEDASCPGQGEGPALVLDCGASGSSPEWAAPSLQRVGDDSSVSLVIRGAPGGSARLYGGRRAIVQFTVSGKIERLTDERWVQDLGALDASGELLLTLSGAFALTSDPVQGAQQVLQVSVVDPSGKLQRSNSLPIILR